MKQNKLRLLKSAFTIYLVCILINVPAYSLMPAGKKNGELIKDYYKKFDFGDNLEMDFLFICVIIVFAIFLWNLIRNMLKNK